MYLSEEAFVLLYKALVRSQLEYANTVSNPYKMGLIKVLEKVQMRAIKLVIRPTIKQKRDFRDWNYQHYGSDAFVDTWLKCINSKI